MKTNFFRLLIFFAILSGSAQAQQSMLYNHYYVNPFLYNPSYIAPTGYTELYLNYRRQWTGINGAPTTGTLNLQVPLSHKAGAAFTAYQDQAGLLKTTTGLISFSYQIYLGERITDIHKVGFGISAGVTNSRIDPDDLEDIQDPVFANSTSSMDGQFGMHYQYNRFKMSFAVPRIFESKVASEKSFNSDGIAQLDNTISSISYDFRISERFSLEPMATYRTYKTLDSHFEVLTTFKVLNLGWIGAAYRQGYGSFAYFGVSVKEKLRIAYAYEFAAEQSDRLGNGSHEFQLAYRIGKKHFGKHSAKKSPTTLRQDAVATQAPTREKEPEAEKSEVKEQTAQKKNSHDSNRSIEPVAKKEMDNEFGRDQTDSDPFTANEQVEPLDQDVKQTTHPELENQKIVETEDRMTTNSAVTKLNGEGMAPGHYVVVGVFEGKQNAKTYLTTLKRAGYPANVAFDPVKKFFIVHMDNPSENIEDARKMRDNYRQMSRYSFRDTWVLTIE